MKTPDDHDIPLINDDDDTSGEGKGGQGGQAGKIHFRFRDAASIPPRDDNLSPSELKRLLFVQNDAHFALVKKQNLLRKERKAIKEGRYQPYQQAQRQKAIGYGGMGGSKYESHPISNRAQFSGIDKQVTGIPNELDAETNLEMQQRLENRNVLQNTPRPSPKFRPPGA